MEINLLELLVASSLLAFSSLALLLFLSFVVGLFDRQIPQSIAALILYLFGLHVYLSLPHLHILFLLLLLILVFVQRLLNLFEFLVELLGVDGVEDMAGKLLAVLDYLVPLLLAFPVF